MEPWHSLEAPTLASAWGCRANLGQEGLGSANRARSERDAGALGAAQAAALARVCRWSLRRLWVAAIRRHSDSGHCRALGYRRRMSEGGSSGGERISAAEVIAALSLATDLSIGFDFEHGLRSTLVAVRLAERLDVDREAAAQSYYACLLQQVGCTADIHMRAKILGDTREVVKNHLMPVWFGEPREVIAALARSVAPDAALPIRAIHMARKVPQAARVMPRVDVACREVARMLIERLGLPASIGALFAYVDERWDGKGPTKAKGDGIPLAMRIAHVARDIDVQRVLGGPPLAAAIVGERAGSALDPAIAARFVEEAEAILAIH